MNFDVMNVVAGIETQSQQVDVSGNIPPVVPRAQREEKQAPLSPVEQLQRKNESYSGITVDHQEPKSHALKNASDRDLEEVEKLLPQTLGEMVGFGQRIAVAKAKLGLDQGGFVDQEIDEINFKTGQVIGKRRATSAEINAEFIAREPMMTDEEIEDFLMKYFVEFDVTTGEVKPQKYPRREGYWCSVTFPSTPVSTGVTPINATENVTRQEPVQKDEPKSEEKKEESDNTPPITKKKIQFRVEEKTIGVRKKISKDKIPALTEMILDRNAVPMTAVASRYKCDITGVKFEEYDQIRSMVETSSLAKEVKMWSIIYRHVKNPTIGEFKNFDDFCEHTAWADRQRFWYALMCAMTQDKETDGIICHNNVYRRVAGQEELNLSDYTEAYTDITDFSKLPTKKAMIPDMNVYTIIVMNDLHYKYIPRESDEFSDTVQWVLVEQEAQCNTRYDVEYYTRSLIDTKNLPSWVEKEINEINEIQTLEEAIQYHEDGALRRKRIISLNDVVSVEVGFKSVADVLKKDYKFIVPEELSATGREICRQDLIRQHIDDPEYKPTEKEIDEYFDSEEAETLVVSIVMCQVLDKVIVKGEDGEEETDDPSMMVDILRQCPPTDTAILANNYDTNHLFYRYATSYEPTFSYKNCVCPSCGYTADVPLNNIRDLVFTLSRSLMNTTFDITSL